MVDTREEDRQPSRLGMPHASQEEPRHGGPVGPGLSQPPRRRFGSFAPDRDHSAMGLRSDHPTIPCTNLRGLRRRLLIAGFVLAGVLIWLGGGRVWAQGTANDRPHYVPKSMFRIPFNIDAGNARLF